MERRSRPREQNVREKSYGSASKDRERRAGTEGRGVDILEPGQEGPARPGRESVPYP